MRKELPEVGWGDFEVLPQNNPAIFAMRYDWRNNSVLFIHNLSDAPVELEAKSKMLGNDCDHLINLLSDAHSNADVKGKHSILLEPYGYRWFRAGGLDYLLKRTEV